MPVELERSSQSPIFGSVLFPLHGRDVSSIRGPRTAPEVYPFDLRNGKELHAGAGFGAQARSSLRSRSRTAS